jgi:hypothetical protein
MLIKSCAPDSLSDLRSRRDNAQAVQHLLAEKEGVSATEAGYPYILFKYNLLNDFLKTPNLHYYSVIVKLSGALS